MNWRFLLLFLVLTAGHTELMVVLVNRLHALRLSCATLRRARHAHDVLIPAFPLLLFWCVGLRGPRLLDGGTLSDVPPLWRLYFFLCLAGAASLCFSAVRHLTRRTPALLVSNHTRTVDVVETLGTRPLGNGPFRWLTAVPGNQIFEIDVAVKELRLSRLPREWDGLSIVHLSDWHFIGTIDRPFFEYAARLAGEEQGDMIVFTGDLLDRQDLADWIPDTLGRLTAPLGRFFILGNHDWHLDSSALAALLVDQGWEYVAGRVAAVEHCGRTLQIGGTERPWMGDHPEFHSSSLPGWEASPPEHEELRVLLSHTPDHIAWARSNNVDLMLAGHNHGGQVVLPILGPVYSPSLSGCRYAGGLFHKPPTVLHVSRGLSGRHPLRINCRPEITRLVLRSPRRDNGVETIRNAR